MKRTWLPAAIVVAAIALAVGEFLYLYPQLPRQVASHFNGAGQPNGWTTKRAFAMAWAGALAMLGFMLGLTLVIAAVTPVSSFNLPNKEYWSAPERAATTRRMILERLLWFLAALVLFVAYLMHELLAFNLQRIGQISVWTPTALFLTFTVVWCGEMFWAFRRIPPAAAHATPGPAALD